MRILCASQSAAELGIAEKTRQLRQKLQQGLGLPGVPTQPAQQVQQAAPPPSSNLPPPRSGTTAQQQQQPQQPADPKKQAIEGLIKGLFGN